MANLPETSVFAAGVTQLELTTPVRGGASGAGESNAPLVQLTNRTRWLKDQVDALAAAVALRAPIASPAFTGSPTTPTAALGEASGVLASTGFVQGLRGQAVRSIAGAATTVLTEAEAAPAILRFTGALTGPATVVVPNRPTSWVVRNETTGGFPVTMRTAGGTGPAVSAGRGRMLLCDGTNVVQALTETEDQRLAGTPTVPTQPPETANDTPASTLFVQRATRGATILTLTGGSYALTAQEALAPVLVVQGALAAPQVLVLPAAGAEWVVVNRTTGAPASTLTVRTGTGTGVVVERGAAANLASDGTDIIQAWTSARSPDLVDAPTAATPAAGDNSRRIANTEWVRAMLANAGWSTGDVKATFKTVADPGWIMLADGSIGAPGSGASYAADDAQPLYALLWGAVAQAHAPVAGGRGASAAADWAAGKRMDLPRALGRSLAAAGQGAGLSARPLGAAIGVETHALSIPEMPAHSHGVTLDAQGNHTHGGGTTSAGAHAHLSPHEGFYANFGGGNLVGDRFYGSVGVALQAYNSALTSATGDHSHQIATDVQGAHSHTATVAATGSGLAHPNMQPSVFVNLMVKL